MVRCGAAVVVVVGGVVVVVVSGGGRGAVVAGNVCTVNKVDGLLESSVVGCADGATKAVSPSREITNAIAQPVVLLFVRLR